MRPGRAAEHSPPSSAAVMEEYSYTSTHPKGLRSVCKRGENLPNINEPPLENCVWLRLSDTCDLTNTAGMSHLEVIH